MAAQVQAEVSSYLALKKPFFSTKARRNDKLSTWPEGKQVVYLFSVKFFLLKAKERKLSKHPCKYIIIYNTRV